MSEEAGRVLIVDDDRLSRSVLEQAIQSIGFQTISASDAEQAWSILEADPRITLACVDWVMPGMDGTELCRQIKHRIRDRYVYTLIVSGKHVSKDDLVHAMAAGADDFVSKPIHPGELVSRLFAGRRVLNYERSLRDETARADALLNSVLPVAVAKRMKAGENKISDFINECSVMFIDVCGFTQWCMGVNAHRFIDELAALFGMFDEAIHASGAEKIKSIGDAYMVAAGVTERSPDHAQILAELALRIHQGVKSVKRDGAAWHLRTGIASGPAIAGVISAERFIYDVWGPTVNMAARLESLAPRDEILTNALFRELLRGRYSCRSFGLVSPKGFDEQDAWLLDAEPA